MVDLFSLRARGFFTMVLVAGGGVPPADCEVPATAMVTIPDEVVDGSVPAVSAAPPVGISSPANSVPFIFWRLGSGGEAGGLQNRQCNQYLTTLQNSRFIPREFDYVRFTSVHYSTTPRDQWQGFGQLHG
jgi:hypothetical protein